METYQDKGIAWTLIHRAPWWVPWMFLLLLWLGWAIYQFVSVSAVADANVQARELIRDAQVAQCERHNDLRREFNAQYDVIEDVLIVASESSLDRGEPEIARRYLEMSREITTHQMVDCEEAFPEDISQASFMPTP